MSAGDSVSGRGRSRGSPALQLTGRATRWVRRDAASQTKASIRSNGTLLEPWRTAIGPGPRKKAPLCRAFLDSGGGIRTRDLRVMSPTSYQTAPPRVAPYVLAKSRPPHQLRLPCRGLATAHRRRRRAHLASPPCASPSSTSGATPRACSSPRSIRTSGTIEELVRRSQVTRLGHGVDATGSLDAEAIERVLSALARVPRSDRRSTTARRTSPCSPPPSATPPTALQFAARVRDRLPTRRARAQRRRRGAAHLPRRHVRSARTGPRWRPPTVVIDIGGGSTEFVVGVGRAAGFHVSLHAGVVRMSERHIHSDPPRPEELQALAQDVRTTLLAGSPPSSAPPSSTASPSPAPPRPPPPSTRSSTPTTPRACTAMCSSSAPSNCCSRASPTWTNASAGRSSASTPTARPRSSPA